jgi:hypothetical protein
MKTAGDLHKAMAAHLDAADGGDLTTGEAGRLAAHPPLRLARWCVRPGIETNDTDGLKASLATLHAGWHPAHDGGHAA